MKFVSVIIPVLNGDKFIEQCLSSLEKLNYPKENIEIIVVDNGSSDKTVEIAKRFHTKIIIERGKTISALRNLGVKYSRGEIFAFLDVDCLVPTNWLNEAVKILNKGNVGAVGCWYELPKDASLIARIWDAHMENRRKKDGPTDWVPGGNLITKKEVFQATGGFNESLITAEDVEFCEKIIKADYTIISFPKIAVIHLSDPRNIKVFFLKEVWRGKGVIQKFMADLPEFRYNKTLIFTFVLFFSLILLVAGVINLFLYGSLKLTLIAFLLMLSIPLFLSLKTVAINKKISYFLPLVFIFLVFGFSRIISFFSYFNGRKIIKN